MASLLRLTIALLVLTAIFAAIERVFGLPKDPEAEQAPRRLGLRRDTWTDLVYWFFTPVVTKAISFAGVLIAVLLLARATGVALTRESGLEPLFAGSWVGSLPRWQQALGALVLLDFAGYWTHRLFHRGRLWRFHAVHHSSRHLTWLSSVRLHPVNELLPRVVQVTALLFLGFDPTVLAGVVPALGFYALLLHARVPWRLGPLQRVIASPAFHRWHHTSAQEGLDKNFAGFFPLWDLLFGTFYLPEGRQPERFGVADDAVPEGFWAQLAWPFRRAPAAPPPT